MSQTVGDLRTLVTRRAGLRRKVAVLSSDAGLTQALEQNGHTLLVDPASLEALTTFAPDVVVAFDGLLAQGAEGFARLAQAAPGAELVFSFANASASSTLLRALQGHSPPPTTSERDVRGWLVAAGYVVSSRDVVVVPHQASGLSAELEAALRQLFEQLNPAAAADRLLLCAKRGAEASVFEPEPELTSVVLSSGDDEGALEGTLRSVGGQLHAPLELIVVAQLSELRLEALCTQLKGRPGVRLVLVGDAPADALSRTNFGLTQARGQYVCCLEAGELLDRSHLASLVALLARGTEAWALSAPSVGWGARFDLRELLVDGGAQRGRWVVDRLRIGAFPLRFAEGLALGEAMFLCRLTALFEPAWSPDCTLDSPRQVSSEPAALLEAMRARPLRTLGRVDGWLRAPPAVDVGAVLEARLLEQNEAAGKLFGQARELAARVRHAAIKAREDARRGK